MNVGEACFFCCKGVRPLLLVTAGAQQMRAEFRREGPRHPASLRPCLAKATIRQTVKTQTRSVSNYSYLRESTGLERATLNDFALTTSNAISKTIAPGNANNHH